MNQQDHRDTEEIKGKNEIRSKTKGGKKKQGHRVIDNMYIPARVTITWCVRQVTLQASALLCEKGSGSQST